MQDSLKKKNGSGVSGAGKGLEKVSLELKFSLKKGVLRAAHLTLSNVSAPPPPFSPMSLPIGKHSYKPTNNVYFIIADWWVTENKDFGV